MSWKKALLWSILAVLFAGIAVLADHYDKEVEAIAFGLVLFLLGVMRRKLVRKILFGLVRPFVPRASRKVFEECMGRWLRRVRIFCAVLWQRFKRRRWRRWSFLVKILVTLPLLVVCVAGMLLAGSFLGLMAAIPAVGGGIFVILSALAGPTWAKELILPFLARIASGYGLDKLVLPVWDIVPKRWREGAGKAYRKLWWRTMRPLVKSRKAVGRRAGKVLRKQKIAHPDLRGWD